jgi:hypothetical protein
MALDRSSEVRSQSDPGLFMAHALVVERWMPVRRIPVAFDCGAKRIADLTAGATLEPDGTLKGGDWRDAGDDPLWAAACKGG